MERALNVDVSYYATARQVTIVRTETIALPQGSTLRDLMLTLAAKHGKNLQTYIFDAAGNPSDHLTYHINGSDVHSLGGFDTELKDRDMVAVIPRIQRMSLQQGNHN